jgi:hypothetical protein
MDSLIVFLMGVLFGAGCFMGYGWYHVNKIRKVKDALLNQIKAKAEEMDRQKNSIKERLTKASELAQQQMALKAQMEMPSQNALHSKYKNGLVGELQDMEQQKLDLLKTVLAEGFDPMITVVSETGVKTEIPLSTYVNEATVLLNESVGTKPAAPEVLQPKKAGKFIVYQGGKDDGKSH